VTQPCTHLDTSPAGRSVARLTHADAAMEGLVAETVIGTCSGCRRLVVTVELRGPRGTGYLTAPAVLRRQGGGRNA
jgi:hypothetical protein